MTLVTQLENGGVRIYAQAITRPPVCLHTTLLVLLETVCLCKNLIIVISDVPSFLYSISNSLNQPSTLIFFFCLLNTNHKTFTIQINICLF